MSYEYNDSNDLLLNNSNSSMILQTNIRLVDSMFPANVNATEVRSVTKEISLNDDNARLSELYKNVERTWAERAFSPITPGSLRGSTFTLISTALGAGVLSLPYMMRSAGLLLGSVYIVLAGLAALWSMYLLSKCSFRTSCNRYSDAVLQLLGPRWSLALQIVLIVYVFGTLVSYFITLNQFIAAIAMNVGAVDENWSQADSPHYSKTYIVISLMAVLAYPMSCIKNLSGLRYLTVFSVFAIIYLITTIVWQAPILHIRYAHGDITWIKIGWGAITSWAVCAFAFTCHANIFPVLSELQHPMLKRTNKIFNRCITVETIMYLSCGVAGYLSLLDQTPQLFVNRPQQVGAYDIPMLIGKIAMAMNLFFVLPVNLNPCRTQILVLMNKQGNPSDLLHYGLTAILLFASAGTAMVFPNIYSAFGILGGFFATMLSYTFPTMIYLKCTNLKSGHYKRSLVILIGTLTTVMGFTSAIVILLQTAKVLPSS